MATHNSTYTLGDILYLKTDPEQLERMCTQVSFKGSGSVVYSLSVGHQESDHYDIEISSKKDLMKELNISSHNDKAQ
jgi:SNF family Na+-dependent transporter